MAKAPAPKVKMPAAPKATLPKNPQPKAPVIKNNGMRSYLQASKLI